MRRPERARAGHVRFGRTVQYPCIYPSPCMMTLDSFVALIRASTASFFSSLQTVHDSQTHRLGMTVWLRHQRSDTVRLFASKPPSRGNRYHSTEITRATREQILPAASPVPLWVSLRRQTRGGPSWPRLRLVLSDSDCPLLLGFRTIGASTFDCERPEPS